MQQVSDDVPDFYQVAKSKGPLGGIYKLRLSALEDY
jgi:hypothetical protein